MVWIKNHTKDKGSKAGILKIAIAETIYGVWQYRNANIFRKNIDESKVKRHYRYNLV